MKNIQFFSNEINFNLKNKTKIKQWISSTIAEEGFDLKDISYIFCNDEFILELNKSALQHNYFTDIITFQYNEKKEPIHSEIYISIDTVKSNAKLFNVSFQKELLRVIIHGVLHCCNYNDKTKSQEKQIREKENYYLSKIEM